MFWSHTIGIKMQSWHLFWEIKVFSGDRSSINIRLNMFIIMHYLHPYFVCLYFDLSWSWFGRTLYSSPKSYDWKTHYSRISRCFKSGTSQYSWQMLWQNIESLRGVFGHSHASSLSLCVSLSGRTLWRSRAQEVCSAWPGQQMALSWREPVEMDTSCLLTSWSSDGSGGILKSRSRRDARCRYTACDQCQSLRCFSHQRHVPLKITDKK